MIGRKRRFWLLFGVVLLAATSVWAQRDLQRAPLETNRSAPRLTLEERPAAVPYQNRSALQYAERMVDRNGVRETMPPCNCEPTEAQVTAATSRIRAQVASPAWNSAGQRQLAQRQLRFGSSAAVMHNPDPLPPPRQMERSGAPADQAPPAARDRVRAQPRANPTGRGSDTARDRTAAKDDARPLERVPDVPMQAMDDSAGDDVIVPGSGCCSYWVKNELAGTNEKYLQPYHAFKGANDDETAENARAFAATVKPSLPFFVPYHDGAVGVGSGWLYGPGRFHGAIDYSKSIEAGEDPSFQVRAIADGRVISVYWDDWFGNTIVIDHTAPNGDQYRSAYLHLRDGRTHDRQMAQAIVVPEDKKFNDKGEATNSYKYTLFAQQPATVPGWGTDAHTIPVSVGDLVHAGQFIAWSGNTGGGGAGNGLKDDGTPYSPATCNNHLHLMTAVPFPAPGSKDWVQVDPYGVYTHITGPNYTTLWETPYARLFAPFYPSFHNVPAGVVAQFFGYYPQMGMGLQTISVHEGGGKLYCSGSFQSGVDPQWYARTWLTGDEYQNWFGTYAQQGYRPAEIQVSNDGSNNPRYSAIWRKLKAGEQFAGVHGVTNAQWQSKWQEFIGQGYRCIDHAGYAVGSGQRHAGIFVKDSGPAFAELHNLSGGQFQTKFDEFWGNGLRLTSINVADLPGNNLYGGVWQQVPGAWVAYHGLTPAGYQQKFDELAGQGYRLYRVQGYDDSDRFAAIWTK